MVTFASSASLSSSWVNRCTSGSTVAYHTHSCFLFNGSRPARIFPLWLCCTRSCTTSQTPTCIGCLFSVIRIIVVPVHCHLITASSAPLIACAHFFASVLHLRLPHFRTYLLHSLVAHSDSILHTVCDSFHDRLLGRRIRIRICIRTVVCDGRRRKTALARPPHTRSLSISFPSLPHNHPPPVLLHTIRTFLFALRYPYITITAILTTHARLWRRAVAFAIRIALPPSRLYTDAVYHLSYIDYISFVFVQYPRWSTEKKGVKQHLLPPRVLDKVCGWQVPAWRATRANSYGAREPRCGDAGQSLVQKLPRKSSKWAREARWERSRAARLRAEAVCFRQASRAIHSRSGRRTLRGGRKRM